MKRATVAEEAEWHDTPEAREESEQPEETEAARDGGPPRMRMQAAFPDWSTRDKRRLQACMQLAWRESAHGVPASWRCEANDPRKAETGAAARPRASQTKRKKDHPARLASSP